MAWLAWPITIIPIVIIFMWVFREPIARLVDRIKKVGKGGVECDDLTEKQIADTKDPAQSPLDAIQKTGDDQEISVAQNGADELLATVPLTPCVQDNEKLVRDGLLARGLDETALAVKVLIRYLAVSVVLLDFEQVHNAIFGSQIQLLTSLNEVVGTGKAWKFIEGHFDDTKEQYPDYFEKWTADTYMKYLGGKGLIAYDNERRCHITEKGREYLGWIVKCSRGEKKLG